MTRRLSSIAIAVMLSAVMNVLTLPASYSDHRALHMSSTGGLVDDGSVFGVKHLDGFSRLAKDRVKNREESRVEHKMKYNRVTTGYQEARNFRGTQFLGNVKMGSNQNFQVVFDTGSSVVMMNSVECKDHSCVTKSRYNGNLSESYKPQKKTLSVSLGSGLVIGKLSQEKFSLAGLVLKDQDFIEIQHPSKTFFHNTYFDGIIGLGLPELAPKGTTSFLSNLKSGGQLSKVVFNLYYDRAQNLSRSHLSFGDPELNFLQNASLNYFPVVSKKYWAIRLTSILVGGQEQGYCLMGCKAIIDSGSSLISAPSSSAYDLIDKLAIDSNCNNLDTGLPSITFVFGKHKYTLQAKDYVLASSTGQKRPLEERKKPNRCIPGIMPMNIPRQMEMTWVLGDIFISRFYLSFDLDNNRIGIGRPKIGEPLQERVKKLESAKRKTLTSAEE